MRKLSSSEKLALESAKKGYLDELAQQEEKITLLELDKESWYEEAYVHTLAHKEDTRTLAEV